ncbi:hypothetical protein ACVGXT_00260, partial [Enterobacter intestinihominis]
SKAIRHRKNNTLRLLPGGAGRSPAFGYVCRVIAPPTRNNKHKQNKKTTHGKIKKKFSLSTVSYKNIPPHHKKLIISVLGILF